MSIWKWKHLTAEPDPNVILAMPLILRMEKHAPPSHNDALIATVKAIATLLDNDIIHRNKHFRREVEMWSQSDIRKVARRARGQRWEDIKNIPGTLGESGAAQVYASIPYDTKNTPTPISRLQVSGLECTRDEQVPHMQSVPGGTVLNVAVNPRTPMSTGKQMAQVGHVSHIAALNSDIEVLKDWKANNFAVRIVDFSEDMPIQVQDLGLTEVEPGTLTAVGEFKV